MAVERLPDLLATVSAGGDIVPTLTRHVEDLEARVALQRQLLQHLRDRLPARRDEPSPMAVTLDRLPSGPVLARTVVVVCLPFQHDVASPEDLPASVAVVEIPDEPFASTVLRGDAATFPAVLDGYVAVSSWMAQHDFAYAGPAYEIYRRWCGRAGHPDNELVVGFPVVAD